MTGVNEANEANEANDADSDPDPDNSDNSDDDSNDPYANGNADNDANDEDLDDLDYQSDDDAADPQPNTANRDDGGGDSPSDNGEGDKDNESDWTDCSIYSDSEQEEPRGRGKARVADKRTFMVNAFDQLAPELQTVAKKQPAKVGKRADKSKAYIKKYRDPIRSAEDLVDLIQHNRWRINPQVGSQALADEIRADPEVLQYTAYLRSCTLPASNKHFLAMWKKVCRLRCQLPIDIISPFNYLEYGATPRVGPRQQWANPIWTPRFCDRLSQLALGGPWGDDMELLALFLRYAVACRINDRRDIPFLTFKNEGSYFLERMHLKLDMQRDCEKSIPQIHHEVRNYLRDYRMLTWHSQLLRNIEKLAYDPTTAPFLDDDGAERSLYRVRTEDLTTVQLAVSNCKDLGRPMFSSVKDSAAIVSHGRNFDFPKIYNDVIEVQVGHHLATEWLIRTRRLQQQQELQQQIPPQQPASNPPSPSMPPPHHEGDDLTMGEADLGRNPNEASLGRDISKEGGIDDGTGGDIGGEDTFIPEQEAHMDIGPGVE
ncbi:hypothetical protein F4821DRAFT_280973 [Hypoxylon rubiginosum]|uniref:Uncharacterized protein n=1 Tax=Hypoxylon rubiginosum TaxID=110542 RepID=A0ACC0CSA7_9PEZI|nr:hypothetical protein F4821DRAFT_280973 [Hypoxylon rubiginosum]